jgi:hippurate hydrolase
VTIDPVMMASRFVVDVQSVISREKDPAEVGIISIGSFNAGTAGNIIPDEAVLRGTIRTFKPDVRAKMFDGIGRTAKAVAAMANAPAPEIIITEGIKAVVNDPALVATVEKALKPALGEKASLSPANTTSEDFSEFGGSGVPLMMFNIGVYDRDAWAAANKSGTPLPGNHSPLFAPVPKPTIQTGVTAMSLAVLSAFDRRAKGPNGTPTPFKADAIPPQ